MAKSYQYQQNLTPDGNYAIVCEGKILKTPAGLALQVPTQGLAEAIVAEWQGQDQGQGQGGKIRKEFFRLTPLACVAIDLAQGKRDAVLADVVPYIDTDAVCYRAGEIDVLRARQQALLGPLIDWVRERFGIRLAITEHMMPVPQPPENSRKLIAILTGYESWKLAAFSVAVKPLGSAVLALALVEERSSAAEAFDLGHLEEAYESEQWGRDEEKENHLNAKKRDVQAVEDFLKLLT